LLARLTQIATMDAAFCNASTSFPSRMPPRRHKIPPLRLCAQGL
jgi:hypothetical protein